jgi:F-type H+-transporting ATPase subunit delta
MTEVAETIRHHILEDVGSLKIARVYADALLAQALQQNQAQEILVELEALIHEVFDRHPELEAFLIDSSVGRETKANTIEKVFSNRVSPLLKNCFLVVNDHDRLELLRAIAWAYRQALDEQEGRQQVLVRSARPLAPDQTDRLRSELRTLFQIEPVLKEETDPDLLGGLVVRVGDWVYDASISTQLEILRNQILERSSHEIQSGRNRFSVG